MAKPAGLRNNLQQKLPNVLAEDYPLPIGGYSKNLRLSIPESASSRPSNSTNNSGKRFMVGQRPCENVSSQKREIVHLFDM
jgi:hypothetical protein